MEAEGIKYLKYLNMSYDDSDEEGERQIQLPPHKIRFTDMPEPLMNKAIQCE